MDRAQVQQLDGLFAARKMRIDPTDLTGSPAVAARHNQRANQSPGDNMTSCWASNGPPPSDHRQATGGSSRYSVVGGQQSSSSATLGSLSTYPESVTHGDRVPNSALFNSHHSNDHQTVYRYANPPNSSPNQLCGGNDVIWNRRLHIDVNERAMLSKFGRQISPTAMTTMFSADSRQQYRQLDPSRCALQGSSTCKDTVSAHCAVARRGVDRPIGNVPGPLEGASSSSAWRKAFRRLSSTELVWHGSAEEFQHRLTGSSATEGRSLTASDQYNGHHDGQGQGESIQRFDKRQQVHLLNDADHGYGFLSPPETVSKAETITQNPTNGQFVAGSLVRDGYQVNGTGGVVGGIASSPRGPSVQSSSRTVANGNVQHHVSQQQQQQQQQQPREQQLQQLHDQHYHHHQHQQQQGRYDKALTFNAKHPLIHPHMALEFRIEEERLRSTIRRPGRMYDEETGSQRFLYRSMDVQPQAAARRDVYDVNGVGECSASELHQLQEAFDSRRPEVREQRPYADVGISSSVADETSGLISATHSSTSTTSYVGRDSGVDDPSRTSRQSYQAMAESQDRHWLLRKCAALGDTTTTYNRYSDVTGNNNGWFMDNASANEHSGDTQVIDLTRRFAIDASPRLPPSPRRQPPLDGSTTTTPATCQVVDEWNSLVNRICSPLRGRNGNRNTGSSASGNGIYGELIGLHHEVIDMRPSYLIDGSPTENTEQPPSSARRLLTAVGPSSRTTSQYDIRQLIERHLSADIDEDARRRIENEGGYINSTGTHDVVDLSGNGIHKNVNAAATMERFCDRSTVVNGSGGFRHGEPVARRNEERLAVDFRSVVDTERCDRVSPLFRQNPVVRGSTPMEEDVIVERYEGVGDGDQFFETSAVAGLPASAVNQIPHERIPTAAMTHDIVVGMSSRMFQTGDGGTRQSAVEDEPGCEVGYAINDNCNFVHQIRNGSQQFLNVGGSSVHRGGCHGDVVTTCFTVADKRLAIQDQVIENRNNEESLCGDILTASVFEDEHTGKQSDTPTEEDFVEDTIITQPTASVYSRRPNLSCLASAAAIAAAADSELMLNANLPLMHAACEAPHLSSMCGLRPRSEATTDLLPTSEPVTGDGANALGNNSDDIAGEINEDDLPMPVIEDMRLFADKHSKAVEKETTKPLFLERIDDGTLNYRDGLSNSAIDDDYTISRTRSETCTSDNVEDCAGPTSSRDCDSSPSEKISDTTNIEKMAVGSVDLQTDSSTEPLAFGRILGRKVELATAPLLPAGCSDCSFRCGTDVQLLAHVSKCHKHPVHSKAVVVNTSTASDAHLEPTFFCTLCSTSNSSRRQHFRHVAHHDDDKQHVVRYYVCSHCTFDCTGVDVIESHVTSVHPTDIFRYEVVQENVEYRRNLVACPVCGEAYSWRSDFVEHVGDETRHGLRELAAYVTNVFEDQSTPPATILIPKNLFRDLPMMAVRSDDIVDSCDAVDGDDKTGPETSDETDRDLAGKRSETDESLLELDYDVASQPASFVSSVVQPVDVDDVSKSMFSLPARVTSANGKLVYRCPLCPVDCVKPAVFRRHVAAHQRHSELPSFYRCGHCRYIHGQIKFVRKHASTYHVGLVPKIAHVVDGFIVEVDAVGADVEDSTSAINASIAHSTVRVSEKSTNVETRPSSGTVTSDAIDFRYPVKRAHCNDNAAITTLKSSSFVADPTTPDADLSGPVVSTTTVPSTCRFECLLPPSMVYQEPVKCPMCDFSSRLRIGLIRHMKTTHKDFAGTSSSFAGGSSNALTVSGTSNDEESNMRTTGSDACSVTFASGSLCDSSNASWQTSIDEASTMNVNESRRLVDERDFIASETPPKSSMKIAKSLTQSCVTKYFGSLGANSTTDDVIPGTDAAIEEEEEEEELTDDDGQTDRTTLNPLTKSRSPVNLTPSTSDIRRRRQPFQTIPTNEYDEFCYRLPNADLYRCIRCSFTDRFPSKVRRHFFYRHSAVPPFRCGHCTFGAKERGKVVKHSRSAHRYLEPIVVIENEDDVAGRGGSGDAIEERSKRLNTVDDVEDDENNDNDGEMLSLSRSGRRLRRVGLFIGRNGKKRPKKLRAVSKGTKIEEVITSSLSSLPDDAVDSAVDRSSVPQLDVMANGGASVAEPGVLASIRAPIVRDPSDRSYNNVTLCVEQAASVDNDETIEISRTTDATSRKSRGRSPIPCETIFAIHRFSFRPEIESETSETSNSNIDVVNAVQSSQPTTMTVTHGEGQVIKSEPIDPDDYDSRQTSTSGHRESASSSATSAQLESTTWKRHYRCAYCEVKSRYGRRDIRSHVFNVHMLLKAFGCAQCEFGHKDKAKVRDHCVRIHRVQRPRVVDNAHLFDAVNVIDEVDGAQLIAFVRPDDGRPLMTLPEVARYFGREEALTSTADVDPVVKSAKRTPLLETGEYDESTELDNLEAPTDDACVDTSLTRDAAEQDEVGSSGQDHIGINSEDITESGVSITDAFRVRESTVITGVSTEIAVKSHKQPSSSEMTQVLTMSATSTFDESTNVMRSSSGTSSESSGTCLFGVDSEHLSVNNENQSVDEISCLLSTATASTSTCPDKLRRNLGDDEDKTTSRVNLTQVKEDNGYKVPNDEQFDKDAKRNLEDITECITQSEKSPGIPSYAATGCDDVKRDDASNADDVMKRSPVHAVSVLSRAVAVEPTISSAALSGNDVPKMDCELASVSQNEQFVTRPETNWTDKGQVDRTSSMGVVHTENVIETDELAPVLFAESVGSVVDTGILSPTLPEIADANVLESYASSQTIGDEASSSDNELPPVLEVQQPLEVGSRVACDEDVDDRSNEHVTESGKLVYSQMVDTADSSKRNDVTSNVTGSNLLSTPPEIAVEHSGNERVQDDVEPDNDDRPWKCRQCSFVSANVEQVWNHIIIRHLLLNRFSCPLCKAYFWKPPAVLAHIAQLHPGGEQRVVSTIEEKADYLRQNVERFDQTTSDTVPKTKTEPYAVKSISSRRAPLRAVSTVIGESTNSKKAVSGGVSMPQRAECDLCQFVTYNESSLAAHRRTHRVYQCAYCEYNHQMFSKVQSHCADEHRQLPVKYTQSSLPSSTSKMMKHQRKRVKSNEGSDDEENNDDVPSGTDADDDDRNRENNQPPSKRKKKAINSEVRFSGTDADDDRNRENNQPPSKRKKKTINSEVRSSGTSSTSATSSTYRCRLCDYSTVQTTMMKHHAMVHSGYYPYVCPYCDEKRAVRSFPVLKHVRMKHSGEEVRFLIRKDDELEKQMRASYFLDRCVSGRPKQSQRVKPVGDAKRSIDGRADSSEKNGPGAAKTAAAAGFRKVVFKCKKCGAKSLFRNDMRHHIMRELRYKPFRCAYCTYAEPSQWSMRKHFRNTHKGLEAQVLTERDADLDRLVEETLADYTVPLWESSDSDLLAWVLQTTGNSVAKQPYATKNGSHKINDAKRGLTKSTSAVNKDANEDQSELGARSAAVHVHQCPLCPYTSSSSKLLHGHKVMHRECRLKCTHCEFRGPFLSRIRRHWKRVHEKDGLPFAMEDNGNDDGDGAMSTQLAPELEATVSMKLMTAKTAKTQDIRDAFKAVTTKSETKVMASSASSLPQKTDRLKHKFQCAYCSEKYKRLFQMRRHVVRVHSDMETKWIDLVTGQTEHHTQPTDAVPQDSQTAVFNRRAAPKSAPRVSRSNPTAATAAKPKKTARRKCLSITKKYLSRDPWSANYRSEEEDEDEEDEEEEEEEEINDIEGCAEVDEENHGEDSDDTIVEDAIDTAFVNVNSSFSSSSSSSASDVLQLHCHLCSYSIKDSSPSALFKHYRTHHKTLCSVPSIDVTDMVTC